MMRYIIIFNDDITHQMSVNSNHIYSFREMRLVLLVHKMLQIGHCPGTHARYHSDSVWEPMPDVTLTVSGNPCPMSLWQCPGNQTRCHSDSVRETRPDVTLTVSGNPWPMSLWQFPGTHARCHSVNIREPMPNATLSVSRNYSTLPLCQCPGTTLHCHSVSLQVLCIATLSVSRNFSTLPRCQSPGTTLHCFCLGVQEQKYIATLSGSRKHCALALCYCPIITVHYLSVSVRQLLHLPLCQYLWNSAHRQAVSDREPLHSATLSRNRSTMPRCRCAETTVYSHSVSVLIQLYAATLCVRKPLYVASLSLSRNRCAEPLGTCPEITAPLS